MKKKQQQKQQACQTPKTKITVQPIASPNSNSNSFSQIFQTFYPRTPVRKVNQQKKDQLGQVMEKGISSFAIATQVTFNSTTKFKNIQNQDHFTQFHVYDKRNKIQDSDWSLLNYKSSQTYTNKTQLFYTLTSVFKHYKDNKDSFFMISNAQFLSFYSHAKDDSPYCLFISRQDTSSKSQSQKSQFLESKQIESIVLGVDTPQSVLFPASQTQFPTKYTLSLIQKKHLIYLFNLQLNIALEKELMDIAANFSFHNSYSHSIQTYNGIDQIEQDTLNLFENNTEFKIQFEGLFNVQQIINLKNTLQASNQDIVVSDIKLNPISTLISKKLLEQINNELK